MKILVAGSNDMIGAAVPHHWMVRKVLLVCGIVSSLFYVATTIVGAMLWEGYSSTSQTVSELFAIGAPTRPLVIPLLIIYALLLYAFGLGIWLSAGRKHPLRIAAVLIVAKEVLGLMATVFAPMHMRGSEGTISDTLHGILTGVGVFLCMLPALVFGAIALGKRFRIYSIATILIFVVNGVLAFLEAPQLAADLPTPWAGVMERTNIYVYMLWIGVLAITLIRAQSDGFRLMDRDRVTHPEGATNQVRTSPNV